MLGAVLVMAFAMDSLNSRLKEVKESKEKNAEDLRPVLNRQCKAMLNDYPAARHRLEQLRHDTPVVFHDVALCCIHLQSLAAQGFGDDCALRPIASSGAELHVFRP
jgi:hypothetical protein